MRGLGSFAAVAIAVAAACGGSSSGGAPDADPNAPDADPNAPDARPPGTPDAAVLPAFPACYRSCTSPAQCDFGSPVNDPDNYACDDGVCRYTGCNSTQECEDTFQSNDYACGTVPGIGTPSCVKTCTSPAQCAIASAAFDADNYACTGGLCEYTGCNSTAECAEAFGAGYGCHQADGFAYASCLAQCGAPADCALATGGALYDADNYDCVDGYCQFTGCNATSECTDSLMDSSYVCRAL